MSVATHKTIDYSHFSANNLGKVSSFFHNPYVILNNREFRENVYGIKEPTAMLSDFFKISKALMGLAYARYNKAPYKWPILNIKGDLEGHTVLRDTENIDLRFKYNLILPDNIALHPTNIEGINTGTIRFPQLNLSLLKLFDIQNFRNIPEIINFTNFTQIRHTPSPVTMEDLIEFEWGRGGNKISLSTAFTSRSSLLQSYGGIPATNPAEKLFLRISSPLHYDLFAFQEEIFRKPFDLLNDLSKIIFETYNQTYNYLTNPQ